MQEDLIQEPLFPPEIVARLRAFADTTPKGIPAEPIFPVGMRLFNIHRLEDTSGVSGEGHIIQGVLFANGTVVIQWVCRPDPGDTQVKRDIEKFLDTHIRSHGYHVLTWDNGERLYFTPPVKEEQPDT